MVGVRASVDTSVTVYMLRESKILFIDATTRNVADASLKNESLAMKQLRNFLIGRRLIELI